MFCKNKKTGFTLVEILIALIIAAFIMATVAIAFNASSVNYEENKKDISNLNNMRQALNRMTKQIRTAQAVDPNAPLHQCTILTADGDNITYSHNTDTDQLFLITNDVTTDSDYLLCNNVKILTFTKETDIEDGITYVKSIKIRMITQTDDGRKYKLSASSVPRRNL